MTLQESALQEYLEKARECAEQGIEIAGKATPKFDCGDNSCRYAQERGGMRTNGGCRCFKDLPIEKRHFILHVDAIRKQVPTLAEQNLTLIKLLEKCREQRDEATMRIINMDIAALSKQQEAELMAIAEAK